jgi:glycerophosphoryl diester phosphodiesterase
MRPIVIAHRGASGYLPDNTLAAKKLAHEMGADYLEQDIVASRDDELIVLHDVHLDRVTDVAARFPGREREDGRYYARDFDLGEIRSLSAWERMNADGSAVFPDRYPARSGNFHLHTLAEELELIAQLNARSNRRAGIYPEIKRPAWHQAEGIDIAPRLLRVLADFGYSEREDPVYVQCFDPAEIERLRNELGCPFKLVQLIGENSWGEASTDFDAMRTRQGLAEIARVADAIGPHIEQMYVLRSDGDGLLPSELCHWAHEVGLTVHPYTFRLEDLPPGFDSFGQLVGFFVHEVGIDGLFTDFPDKVLQLRFS